MQEPQERTLLAVRVQELKALSDGWQEPDSKAIDPALLDHFVVFLTEVARLSPPGLLPQPYLYGCLDGGAQAEWDHGGVKDSSPVASKHRVFATHRDLAKLLTQFFRTKGAQ